MTNQNSINQNLVNDSVFTSSASNSKTSLGFEALSSDTTGTGNVAIGYGALTNVSSGSWNLALGTTAGQNYTTSESNNVSIANEGVIGESSVIRIGTQGTGAGQQNTCYVAGITGSTPVTGNTPQVVLCDNAGNLAAISSSTSGFVLTSNGSATPSFQANPGTGGFTKVVQQVFTSSGTYTPTSGMEYCFVQMVGGGGGGGGCSATGANEYSCGSGGSGAEYAQGLFSSGTIGASQSVTIGTAGGGGSGGSSGSGGGTTSLGSLLTATGGVGGATAGASANGQICYANTPTVAGTGGNLRFFGTTEMAAFAFVISGGASITCSAKGGSTPFGSGGTAIGSDSPGESGFGYGSGGGSAVTNPSNSAQNGGNGAPGLVLITEYCN